MTEQDPITDAESVSEYPQSFDPSDEWEERAIYIDGDEFVVLYNPAEGRIKLP